MAKPKKPRTLKQEQEFWYKKLKAEGFEDVESDEHHLKFYTSQFAAKFIPETWQAKANYYQMATNFLEEYKFDNNLERAVWEYHVNAISYRDIAKLLKKLRLVKRTNRTTIYQLIKRLKTKMFDMYVLTQTEYHE